MSDIIAALKPRIKTAKPRRISLDAYFKAEEKSLEKNEFHNGIILKTAGGTFNQGNLSIKTGALMSVFVEENDLNFNVNGSDLKIHIDEFDKIVCANALVVLEKPRYFNNRKDTITNPILVLEVPFD